MAIEGFEQRNLAAIMFTDMVGYSGLAQRDEGLAVELLEEHRALLRPAFLKHQGQEIKTIGDGFLVEFASAVAAVKCAVELQEGLARRNLGAPADRQLQVRIGIHLGDVLRRGDDIVGDGVNIAARVEPLADSGGIAITQQVFDQVYNKIPETLARIGKIELKNIQRPVEVYRIILGPKTREAAAGERETSAPARQPSREQQRSIAVLPFVNMSSDRENEFLSDGISEDLLNALSWIEGLRVAARTSCFAFKGRNEDIRTIGDALGVETVLEGSLRRVGTKLRITAQLIKVADGFSLWSERFDREMQDVFAIQDDITRAIMAALKLRLAGRSDQPVFKLQTTNAEAYELYLKGRFFWNQRGIGLRKALHYFELALIEDPDYALAMSGLSDTYSLLSWYGDLPPAEAIPKAIAPAKRAVQLDPQLAEAHTSLGFSQLFDNWDRAGAEREFRRAIALNHADYPCALLARLGLFLRWAPRRGRRTLPAGGRARAFFGNRSNVSRADELSRGKVRRSRAPAAQRDRTGWGAAFRFRNFGFWVKSMLPRASATWRFESLAKRWKTRAAGRGRRACWVTPGACSVNLPKRRKFWRTCRTRTNTATFARLASR